MSNNTLNLSSMKLRFFAMWALFLMAVLCWVPLWDALRSSVSTFWGLFKNDLYEGCRAWWHAIVCCVLVIKKGEKL